MSKNNVNRNNHLGLDMGQFMALVMRRDWAGVDKDGNPAYTERGYIRGYLCAGVPQPRLGPKKGELDLWTVVIDPGNGVPVAIRADMIVAAVPSNPPQMPEHIVQTDEVVTPPAPGAAKPPRKRAPAKPKAVPVAAEKPTRAPRKPATK